MLSSIKICVVSVWALMSILFPPIHPIHVTRTEINYESKSQSLQLTLFVYIDDLEDAVKQTGQPVLHLATSKELKNADVLLHNYLKNVLKIASPNRSFQINWVGKELSDSPLAMFIYLEIEDVQDGITLSMKNDVLLDLYDDQTNIIESKKNNKAITTVYIKERGKSVSLKF